MNFTVLFCRLCYHSRLVLFNDEPACDGVNAALKDTDHIQMNGKSQAVQLVLV